MPDKRKAYAPFSLITESGVTNAPVEGYIDVNQEIQPTVSTGTVNENGVWTGVKSDDNEFIGFTKHVQVANGGETLNPDTGTVNFIDMTGFNDVFIAINVSNGGSFAIKAVMGPDTNRFANLQPVNPATTLKGSNAIDGGGDDFNSLLSDSTQVLTADVWEIFFIKSSLKGQKNLQFQIINGTGAQSDIQFAFMRLV